MGVRASITPPADAVPGTLATCDVRVENTSTGPGTFALSVTGPAAEWSWVTPPTLDLGPGGSAGARIAVKVPRSPAVAAGSLPLTLEVRSTGRDPRTVATAGTVLEVAPFVDLFASVEPRTAKGSRVARYTVRLENRGNAPVRVEVEAVDVDEALALDVDPPVVDLGHRGEGETTVTATPRARFPVGPSRPRPFTVVARPAAGSVPERLDGKPAWLEAGLDQQPTVPRSAFAVVGALVALAVAVSLLGGGWTSPLPTGPPGDGGPSAAPLPDDRPDPSCIGRDHLASEANGVVRPELAMPQSWSFLKLAADGCTPVRFDPCRPIRYVTSGSRARPADRADLAEALRRVTEATGVEFVHEGEVPDDPRLPDRPAVVAGPVGARWAPVHIAWVGKETIGRARGAVPSGPADGPAGTTTTVPDVGIPGAGLPVESQGVYVTGLLLLNVDAVSDLRTRRAMPSGFGRGPNWGRVMLHELGHLLGLGHVRSTANLMHHQLGAQTSGGATFGAGDRIGLDAVGRKAGCLETPAPPAAAVRR